MRGGGSVSIPRCPNLNRVLFVDGLKANLISTSQIGDSELSVKFSQDMCEVFNRKREITFIGIELWIIFMQLIQILIPL